MITLILMNCIQNDTGHNKLIYIYIYMKRLLLLYSFTIFWFHYEGNLLSSGIWAYSFFRKNRDCDAKFMHNYNLWCPVYKK